MRIEAKLWEHTLYKLVLAGTLHLNEARILKCLWEHGKLDLWQASQFTGLEAIETAEACRGLHEKGVIRVTPEGYEVEAMEAVLDRLIEQTSPDKRGILPCEVQATAN
ncbi:MAG TPA: hypothetical protein HA252_05200 [Candidatus Diapherotrites archaeon]|uniref:Winged helix-turn-helix domain-containing protein n=1 Tax=Candidatus Iainarchaeum sp. TaxID=3101447 RepID=A0A7J4JLJ9_9ARCH|nr:hypothetical protein [Candidatus Diapherotrites archaeon]